MVIPRFVRQVGVAGMIHAPYAGIDSHLPTSPPAPRMSRRSQLTREAQSLPIEERKSILANIPETELHGYLAELFRALNPDYWVEVTHGTDEFGRDLVIVRDDPLSPDVMAVVVKRGDIKARTAGDVDSLIADAETALKGKPGRAVSEILSQIRQAQLHPSVLKGYVAELITTKVIVVLVGEMSKNVHSRFEREMTIGQVFDLPWLVQQFTAFYPQIFFEGHAVDYLDRLIVKLERDGFYSKADKTLSECFVEPIIAQSDRQILVDDTNLALKVRNKRFRFPQLAEVVREKRRVLLVGDAGSGKSKAAAKLCIDGYHAALAQLTKARGEPSKNSIPVLVQARELQGIANADALFESILPVEVRTRFQIDILVIDGLDEVAADDRHNVLAKATSFADTLNSGLLVTSRKIAAFSAAPEGFARYELMPFEFSQAIQLMKKVVENEELIPALREGLERIQNQIPMNPLSLLLLVELVTERKEVPSSITELYDRFLDLVFGRWDQEKGIEVLFDYLIKKRFLASLAYTEFQLKDRLEIPSVDFEAFLNAYAVEYGWDDAKLREFVKEVERAGILTVQEDVFFRHRSFLDYFVGLHLFDQRATVNDLLSVVTTLYFSGVWTEVAFFYVGLGREMPTGFLERVFNYAEGENDYPVEKLLAGHLLQAGWHSPTKLKEQGLRGALERLPQTAEKAIDYVRSLEPTAGSLYADLFALILAEYSLGSIVVSTEAYTVLKELAQQNSTEKAELFKRVCLLWVGRRFMDPAEHQKELANFVKHLSGANLSALDEARLLVLAGISDTANTSLQKAVSRRLKRLTKYAPTTLHRLLPSTKKQKSVVPWNG